MAGIGPLGQQNSRLVVSSSRPGKTDVWLGSLRKRFSFAGEPVGVAQVLAPGWRYVQVKAVLVSVLARLVCTANRNVSESHLIPTKIPTICLGFDDIR